MPSNKHSLVGHPAKPTKSTSVLQQQYPMDNSYPVTTTASAVPTHYNNRSHSRHGMATFSSRAEQQSIFKPPPGVANNVLKYVTTCYLLHSLFSPVCITLGLGYSEHRKEETDVYCWALGLRISLIVPLGQSNLFPCLINNCTLCITSHDH